MHGDIVSNVRENLHYLDVSIFNHILSGSIIMILDNMKFTDKESLTFVPIKLINTFCHFLDVEHPEVDFKCIKAKDIQRNPELRKKYRPYQEQCRKAFIQAGFEDNIEADGYDGFISNIDSEWLFNLICTFFKPDVNPIAYEYMERSFGSYDPDNDDRILPTIWRSRFNIIGDGKQCDQLENLIENCNLTNDDLALILQTLELK